MYLYPLALLAVVLLGDGNSEVARFQVPQAQNSLWWGGVSFGQTLPSIVPDSYSRSGPAAAGIRRLGAEKNWDEPSHHEASSPSSESSLGSSSPSPSTSSMNAETAESITCSAEASLFFGGISGYVQTPKGGRIGSTSLARPTLNELNINTAVAYDSKVSLGKGNARVYLGARAQQFTGTSILAEELMTKEETFPAGQEVETFVGLDWYRFGFQHTFELAKSPTLRLSPSTELLLFDFGYQLKGEGDLFIRRRYAKGSWRVGVELDYTISEDLSVSLDVFVPVPVVRTHPRVIDINLKGEYRLVKGDIPVRVHLGLGYASIDYEDTQPIPNHIRTEMGPFLMAGIEVSF
ncbi:MAG: hypothetical protein O7H41_12490 [Planctomycetota bacterium]|nr:hypothetical protein [Planctomycetota bacterium]